MSAFILYISEVNPPKQDFIERIISMHETNQDVVLVKNVDQRLNGGFTIFREDELGTDILKRDKLARESLDHRALKGVAKQKSYIKDGAKYSGDTSITKGEKPYKANG